MCQKKDGEIIPVHLSLTEQQFGDGRRYFTGVMRNVEEEMETKKSVLQQEREVLDNLIVPAMIVDEAGKIHAFNQTSSNLLGYSLLDVIGRNVSMLMTPDEAKQHEAYIKDYIATGESHILGTGRDVIAAHKDGTLVPVHLTFSVKRDGPKYIFTGIMQRKL